MRNERSPWSWHGQTGTEYPIKWLKKHKALYYAGPCRSRSGCWKSPGKRGWTMQAAVKKEKSEGTGNGWEWECEECRGDHHDSKVELLMVWVSQTGKQKKKIKLEDENQMLILGFIILWCLWGMSSKLLHIGIWSLTWRNRFECYQHQYTGQALV